MRGPARQRPGGEYTAPQASAATAGLNRSPTCDETSLVKMRGYCRPKAGT